MTHFTLKEIENWSGNFFKYKNNLKLKINEQQEHT